MEKGLKDDAEACADASSNQLKAHESMIKPAKQRTRDDDESVNESGETRTDDNLEQTSLKRAKIDEGGEKSDAKLVEAYAETTTGLNESDKKISMPDSVASHYNAVPNLNVKERTQSKIFYLRNFNNWIKSMLIGEFLERLKNEGCPFATVLDLCCGKGGDLRKWKIGNIKEIVMADIAEVALNHCRDRYNELRDRFTNERRRPFNAHFVLVDATKDDVMACDGIPDRDMRFDICSCQFALHYSFESEAKARCLLWNATHALRPGGYFIATISDANVILQFLRNNGSGTFKNKVCQIHLENFDRDTQPPLFGAKLNFELDEVVNCPEFLAYFPLVQRILEEYGMKLVYKMSFPEALNYYIERNENAAKLLMDRMRALELYPTSENSASTEYAHAARKLESLTADKNNKKIGTLSNSEWQVVSMYILFAFVKET